MTAPVFTRPIDCPGGLGVRMLGTGSKVPPRELTNHDLARMMDTSDEWIVQRTGIRSRRICDPSVEGTFTLARDALKAALDDAKVSPKELDLIICGTCTMEMTCPSTACRISAALDAAPAAAFDVVAACSGFVYSLNVAETLVRSGRFRTVGVIGCDAMSTAVDFTERTVSILFGDAAGAAILRADPDPSKGAVYQSMGADGIGGHALYIPRREQDIPPDDRDNPIRLGNLRMNGREVFKFAVTRFREVIEDAMAKTGLKAEDVGQVICHQSNLRIIDAAREKIGFREDQIYVNIDRYGNSSAGSVGLCLDEARRAGRIPPGKPIILVAFGGGLTWAANVWNF